MGKIGMRRGNIFAAANVAVPAEIDHLKARLLQGEEVPLGFFLGSPWPQEHGGKLSSCCPSLPLTLHSQGRSLSDFTQTSTDKIYSDHMNASGGDPTGQLGPVFRWKTIRDEARIFGIDLRLVTKTELKTSSALPTSATTAVSLRRLHHFKIEPRRSYRWILSHDGTTQQAGKATPEDTGLLTTETLNLLDQSARLRIAP